MRAYCFEQANAIWIGCEYGKKRSKVKDIMNVLLLQSGVNTCTQIIKRSPNKRSPLILQCSFSFISKITSHSCFSLYQGLSCLAHRTQSVSARATRGTAESNLDFFTLLS